MPFPRHFRSLTTQANKANLLTLLHKMNSFLAAAKPPDHNLWHTILESTYADLTDPVQRPSRVVVYGIDRWSSSHDLVTAVLDDPFKIEASFRTFLSNRWASPQQKLVQILHADAPVANPPFLHLPSSILSRYTHPIQITELSTANPSQTESNIYALHTADIPIVVWNPLTTPIQKFGSLDLPLTNPNLMLVVTVTPSSSDLPCLPTPIPGHQLIYLDPSRALQAQAELRKDPSSPLAIQKYQDGYLASNIPLFKSTLDKSLTLHQTLHIETVISQLQGALVTCSASFNVAKRQLDELATDIAHLRHNVQEARTKARHDVFVYADKLFSANLTANAPLNRIAAALDLAEEDIKQTIDRLTWWRVLWRVDDVTDTINDTIKNSRCKELEKQLVFHAGRLSTSQAELTKATFSLLSHHSQNLNSPVLHNDLAQLTVSSYALTPDTLTAPLRSREAQITRYTTPRLHLAAQRLVFNISGSIATGAGISWVGWFGWLTSNGEGLLGFLSIDTPTSMAAGALIAVTGLRIAIGKWEKAKVQWWDDWYRVGSGLDRDLKVVFDQVIDKKVTVVANEGMDRLEKLSDERQQRIEKLEEEMINLQENLDKTKVGSRAK